ncbi:MAG: flavin reductase family protein [Lachnospiraceae bacterium]|nr:flavin reductase family protein [Lachnospiraceae bacterium]
MSKESWKAGNMLYPVPAVMVSCQREGERPNIITIAWTGTICTNPPMLSISIRPERYSYDIIKETGEFVVNIVNKDTVFACDYCGVRSGRDVDKFKETGLSEYVSDFIGTPAIAECPVNIYCKVNRIVELGSHNMFIADVVGVTVEDEYMDDSGRFALENAAPISYSHGEYFEMGEKLGKFGYSVQKKGKKAKDAGGVKAGKAKNAGGVKVGKARDAGGVKAGKAKDAVGVKAGKAKDAGGVKAGKARDAGGLKAGNTKNVATARHKKTGNNKKNKKKS